MAICGFGFKSQAKEFLKSQYWVRDSNYLYGKEKMFKKALTFNFKNSLFCRKYVILYLGT